MTDRQDEVDAATLALQLELARVAADTAADALALWNTVPPVDNPNAASWLAKAIQMVMVRRRRTRELGRSYYRLVRALTTGTTVGDYHRNEDERVSLNDLRREFTALTDGHAERAQEATEAPPQGETPDAPSQADSGQPRRAVALPEEDELERILVEELQALEETEARIEREAEEELRVALAALGPDNMARKLGAIDPNGETTPADLDAKRAEAHLQAGARQAAAAQRVTLNGARSALWNHSELDGKAIGYVRVSRTGTPCGWCAMLISRGPVYKSAGSATREQYGDGDLYHDNCHCYAVPVFSDEQYEDSPLFDLNRKYEDEWPRVTRGLNGKTAVSAWRKHIRNEKASRAQAA